MAQVLQVAGDPSRPPIHRGPYPFPPYLLRARVRRTSVIQRDTHQEAVHGTITLFNRANIWSCGSQRPHAQQVGQARLLVGTATRHIRQVRPPPPRRVRPIHVSFLQALDAAQQGSKDQQQAISALAWIALFLLLSPGE